MYWISIKESEIGGYRMLKQRTWVIYVRPCTESSGTTTTVTNQLGKVSVNGNETMMKPWTKAVPFADGISITAGCWTEWHRTRSYINLVREVRKLLKTISREDVMITELLDLDTMITPRS